jgi:hypothetical protein
MKAPAPNAGSTPALGGKYNVMAVSCGILKRHKSSICGCLREPSDNKTRYGLGAASGIRWPHRYHPEHPRDGGCGQHWRDAWSWCPVHLQQPLSSFGRLHHLPAVVTRSYSVRLGNDTC